MVFFLLGCALLVGAFVSAALETMARVKVDDGALMISAYELWYTMWPDSLIHARIVIERDVHPALWDPILVTVLVLPAWLLIGAPGAALLLAFRPSRGEEPELDEGSLYVFDDLARAAREDGYEETADDIFSEHDLKWTDDDAESAGERAPGEVPEDWRR